MTITAAGNIANLITARWFSGPNKGTVISRLTDYTTSIAVGSDPEIFTALPYIKINFREQTITMDDAPATIDLPAGGTVPGFAALPPYDELAAGIPLPQVRIDIDRCDPEAGNAEEIEASRYCEWAGLAGQSWENSERRKGINRVRVIGVKGMTQVPLSIVAGARCSHAEFGDAGCRFDRTTLTYDGVIREINADGILGRLVVDFDGTTPDLADLRWRNGDIDVEGAVVQIRASRGATEPPTAGDAVFDVIHVRLPSSWVGRSCVIREGCDRTLERCEQLGNTRRNIQIGAKMPTNNPSLETRI